MPLASKTHFFLEERVIERDPAAAAPRPAGLISRDFVLACAANFAFFGSMHYLLPALPLYVLGLGGQESDVGLIMGTFTVTAVLIRPFVGSAVDHWGRKPFLLLGALIFALASFAYSFVTSVPLLYLVRAFHGAGIACFTTAAGAYIADIVPAARRGVALGLYGTFSNVAMSIGPFLGGMQMRAYGLATLFATSAASGLASLAVISLVREPARRPAHGSGPAQRSALVSRPALLPSFVMFSLSFTYGAVLSFLPLMAAARHIANYELFFTVFALGLIAVRAVAGEVSDRIGRGTVVVPGLLAAATATLIVARADSLPVLLMAAGLYGLGFGSANPALMALTVDRAGTAGRGAGIATFGAAFDLGIGAGSMALGYLLTFTDYATMYTAAAGAIALGILVFVVTLRGSPLPARD